MDAKNTILQMAEEEDVEFIRLQFTDMFGTMKNIAVPFGRLQNAMDNDCMIDMSFIGACACGEEADMYLHPDLSTFTILPWRPQQGKVARMICDICREDGRPYEESSRYILQRTVQAAKEKGYSLMVNPECEFFLFHTDDNGMPTTITHEQAGYMDLSPVDLGENARRDMVLTLEEMGYEIASSHHEISPGQHEIDFRFSDALATADKVMTFKVAVRSIAKRHGLHATFMPKPRAGTDGSGMHLNMYLEKNGSNIFTDSKALNGMSAEGYAFLAGIFSHMRAITALCNPLVNSYKRLVTGFEAPSEITWSAGRGTALARIKRQRAVGTELELRSPDGASNPYLVFAVCLAAGLSGIERKLAAPDESCGMLPKDLGEALEAFREDSLMKEVLGESFVRHYAEAKRKEWEAYMEQVSEWEINQYLYRV